MENRLGKDNLRQLQYEHMYEYQFNMPGVGVSPDYIVDPHIRLTGFGGNRMTDLLNVEDGLKNRGRQYSHCLNERTMDELNREVLKRSVKREYSENNDLYTEQSLTIAPRFLTKEKKQEMRDHYLSNDYNPQYHYEIPFETNVNVKRRLRDQMNIERGFGDI